jgi:D-glycero-D-manno-heptose 1,7-bisphosphate phosphatase
MLDRDGILNQLVARPGEDRYESPLSPCEVRLEPGAADALRLLRSAGFLLACVTNQPSAAKGLSDLETVHAVQRTVLRLLRDEGVALDAVRLCPHHEQASRPDLLGPCRCRKPAPGMLLDVLEELNADPKGSWMIGDTDADVVAGQAAGVRTALVRNRASQHKRSGQMQTDLSVTSLQDAATMIAAGPPPPLY